jgi:transcriptional regulator NrdR family protein
MTMVIKRDGAAENFSRDKIRRGIESAAKRVKLDKSKMKDIADKVSRNVESHFRDRDEVKSSDIRSRVLSELEREEKKVAKEFRAFRKD